MNASQLSSRIRSLICGSFTSLDANARLLAIVDFCVDCCGIQGIINEVGEHDVGVRWCVLQHSMSSCLEGHEGQALVLGDVS